MSRIFFFEYKIILKNFLKKMALLTLDVHIPLGSGFPLDHSTSASLHFRSARWMVLLLPGKLNVKYSSKKTVSKNGEPLAEILLSNRLHNAMFMFMCALFRFGVI